MAATSRHSTSRLSCQQAHAGQLKLVCSPRRLDQFLGMLDPAELVENAQLACRVHQGLRGQYTRSADWPYCSKGLADDTSQGSGM